MDLKIIKESKNKIEIEIKEETHTFCNLLKSELWNDAHVKVSAYRIDHPMSKTARLLVETDSKETPRKAIASAIKRLESQLSKFKQEAKKIKS